MEVGCDNVRNLWLRRVSSCVADSAAAGPTPRPAQAGERDSARLCETLLDSARLCETLLDSARDCETLRHSGAAGAGLARCQASTCTPARSCAALRGPARPCSHLPFTSSNSNSLGSRRMRRSSRTVLRLNSQSTRLCLSCTVDVDGRNASRDLKLLVKIKRTRVSGIRPVTVRRFLW